MQITEIQLQTAQLAEQKAFFHQTLELPLLAESPTSFMVQAGASSITFHATPDPLPSIYHFAFNIPENQLAEAKQWLAPRVTLLRNGERDEWFFADWNAHAVYYLDPAGNILEFIARHNLPTASIRPFSWPSILSVSEIGLVTPNVHDFCQQLHTQLGVTRWRGNDTDFAAVGDEEGLFIVAVTGRPWNGTESPAQPLPTKVVLRGAPSSAVAFARLPYAIQVQA